MSKSRAGKKGIDMNISHWGAPLQNMLLRFPISSHLRPPRGRVTLWAVRETLPPERGGRSFRAAALPTTTSGEQFPETWLS